MNYIIFDLEYNQQHPDDIKASEPKPPLLFEIIQIGAIKINKNLNLVSTFNSLIRPNLHLKLHPYVEECFKLGINPTFEGLNNYYKEKALIKEN